MVDAEEDDKKHQRNHNDNLRQETETEPEDDKWDERNTRHRVHDRDKRLQDGADTRVSCKTESQHDTEQGSESRKIAGEKICVCPLDDRNQDSA